MAGYGLGFGSHSSSRQYAALGQNVPVAALLPSSNWDGTVGSGFSGAPPVDPLRTTAKPVCRLLTPPNQFFTNEIVVGVWAAANHNGSLLDDLGIEKVIAHCEGESFEISAPSFYLQEDSNGILRRYLGWYVVLKHSGSHGHMQVYFEAVPKDPTMQHRVVGPYQFSPQPVLHDYEIEVAATPAVIMGERYKTVVEALNYLTSVSAQNPLITITESFTGDISFANFYAGGEGYCTITANEPVTIRKPGPSVGAAALIRPRVDGLWFKGANITFDFHHAAYIYHENPANRPHVFDGVNCTDSGGRYYTYLGGSKPTLFIARDRPWFLECNISVIQDACNNAPLVRGCTIGGGNRDAISGAQCVIGNRISGWSSDEWREEIDALSVEFTGVASSATLALSGGNEANARVFTARQDGAIVDSFTVFTTEAAFNAGTNYTVANVAAWLNSLPGWSAIVLDDTRRATSLSVASNSGAAFAATDVKTAPLTLVTMFDQHADIWALDSSSDENVLFVDNLCFGNVVQGLFVGPPSGLRDCMILNNTFDQDESSPDFGALLSQMQYPCSHVVVAHNSWSNQLLVLRSDSTFDPDTYCLIANNVMPQLAWNGSADPALTLADNHLFDGASVPSGAVGTVVGGAKQDLFLDPGNGDFTPLGALLFNPKAPVVRHDIFGIARGIPVSVGAAAGGGEVAPAITSSNPSGTYAEGVLVGGTLTANKPVTWSVSGADAAAVSLSAETGDWSLAPTDFETKTNYAFTFRATDSGGDSVEQIVALSISDLDEIAPALSSPQSAADGSNAATLSVSTDEANGTLFWYLSASPAAPAPADIISGTGAIASGLQAVGSIGVQPVSVSGLTAGASYFAHFLHRDGAGNQSAVVSGSGFSTDGASVGSVSVVSYATVLNTSDSSDSYTASPFTYSGASGNTLIAIVAVIQGSNQSVADMSATVDGVAMTRVSGMAHASGNSRPMAAVFAISGLAAGAKSIAVSIASTTHSCTILAAEVGGLDAANLLANMNGIEGSGASYSHSYTPNAAGNLIMSLIATRRGERGPFTPDSGVFELQDASTGDTGTSDHSAFAGYVIATGTAAVDVGAQLAFDPALIFVVTEFNAA